MSEDLGRRVKLARVACGLQQTELAAAAGLRSASYISMLERGKRTPSMRVLRRLADVLGVTTQHLIHGTDPPEPQSLPPPTPPLPPIQGDPARVMHLHGRVVPIGQRANRVRRLNDELLALMPWWSRAPRELRQAVKILLAGYFEADPPPLDVLQDTLLSLLQYNAETDYGVHDQVAAYLTDDVSPEDRQRLEALLQQEEEEREALRERLLSL